MVTPTRIGSSFLVNAVTAGSQERVSAEGLANGRLFLTYDSHDGATAADWTVVGQIMAGFGSTLPAPFTLQTNGATGQPYSTVTQLADGNLLVVWADQLDASERAIHAGLYSATGVKIGSDFRINSTTAGDQAFPSITALADGGFVAVWTDSSGLGGDASGTGIKARIYSAGFQPGVEFQVNTTTAGAQIAPHVTALHGGGFAVTWLDTGATGLNPDEFVARAQLYSASGVAISSEISLDITRGSLPATPEVSVQVAGLAGGDVAFVWVSRETAGVDQSGSSIRSAIYSATGVLKFAETQVNTTTAGDQTAPTVVALGDGRFMVAWVDGSAGAGNEVIRAQVMNADGTRSFSEFSVHNSGFTGGSAPNLTEMADGRVFVSWSNPNASFDGSAASIVGQYIDPRVAGINLNGTAGADSYLGSTFADTIAGLDGDDSIYAGAGNDMLYGGIGNDFLEGGAGADRAYYTGTGPVVVNLSLTGAQVTGQGTDTLLRIEHLTSGDGNDQLTGNALANNLIAGLGDDTLSGGAGNDTLSGGDGNDQINGGLGRDLLHGGGGADAFIFGSAAETGLGATRDRVVDFQAGTDHFVLTAFMSGGQFIGSVAFTGNADDVRYVQSTGVLSGDLNGDKIADWQIVLTNKAVLTAGDFIF